MVPYSLCVGCCVHSVASQWLAQVVSDAVRAGQLTSLRQVVAGPPGYWYFLVELIPARIGRETKISGTPGGGGPQVLVLQVAVITASEHRQKL